MKYIKFGEKINGRYKKAEELSLEQFEKYITCITRALQCPKRDIWSKITGKTKKQEMYNIAYIQGYKDAKKDVIIQIKTDIELDKPGKKFIK